MLKVTYPGEQFIWCSLLPLSQSNLGHPPTLPPPPQKKKRKVGEARAEFPVQMHLESAFSACIVLPGDAAAWVPPGSWGLSVAAVTRVVSDPRQQLLDANTAAASLWVQHWPERILWLETGSFYAQGLRGPFQEKMMISCPAGSDCFKHCGPLALCQDQLGPLPRRRGRPTHQQFPVFLVRWDRRRINEEQDELYWSSLFCVLWIWPFRDKAQLSRPSK